MLVTCPDCGRDVSDRARACPGCGFPIAEHVAEQAQHAALARDRESRREIGEVDCVHCEARGFQRFAAKEPDGRTSETYAWCEVCEHTGRVTLVQGSRGYYAVARPTVESFLAGTRDDGDDLVVFLGEGKPTAHRYPSAGKRYGDDET
jgi:hypothetical protein